MSIRPHRTKSKKHPGRYWTVDIGRGKDRQLITVEGTYEDAALLEKQIKQTCTPASVPIGAPKIKEMVVPFLAWYSTEHPKSITMMRSDLNLKIIPQLGNYRPAQLSPDILGEFRQWLVSQGLMPSSVNKVLDKLSALLKWGVAYGHCQPIGFSLPYFPPERVLSPRKRPLTPAQVDAILEHLPKHYHLIYLLMVDLGLRRQEALRLRVEDVDIDNQVIQVLGKGGKHRSVPIMSDRVEVALVEAMRGNTGYLTISERSGRPHTTIRTQLHDAAQKAEIQRKVNHHLLRHTFASQAAMDGMAPYALQQILGHSSIETTMQIYTHIGKGYLGDEARKLRAKKSGLHSVRKLHLVKG